MLDQVSNHLRMECLSIPELVPIQYKNLVTSIETIIEDIANLKVDKIILTGCGDSYFAAVSAKPVFDKYLAPLKIKTVAMQAIEVSRYYQFKEDEKTLVVVVTASGSAARLVEVLKRAQKYNIPSLVITNKQESIAAKEAKYVLFTNTPDFPKGSPGLRSYLASTLGLELLAMSLSETLTDNGNNIIKQFEEELMAYTERIIEVLPGIDHKAMEIAQRWNKLNGFEVVVDAPYFATGKFVAAKYAEVSGDMCTVIDSENYCHVNTFVFPRNEIATLLIIDTAEGNYSRILETFHQATLENRDTAVVLIGDCHDFDQYADKLLQLPSTSNSISMLFAYIPGALMASHQAEMDGSTYFRGGEPYNNRENITLGTSKIIVM